MQNRTSIQQHLCSFYADSSWHKVNVLQPLWSGYGEVARYANGAGDSLVVKHAILPTTEVHPRGWQGERSQQRKLRSFAVEHHFYTHYATRCNQPCFVPKVKVPSPVISPPALLMQDLDSLGYTQRPQHVTASQISTVLKWLASFHSQFFGNTDEQLWPIGTYWHLATRPDELHAMARCVLKDAAAQIDNRLNAATFKTLVHGDAKLANFCFTVSGKEAAAVDFQYVGQGVGVKDVAYFLGSCLSEAELIKDAERYLEDYFAYLAQSLANTPHAQQSADIVEEWRGLYPLAWADFHRFLLGWNPTHYKVNRYMASMTEQALSCLTA